MKCRALALLVATSLVLAQQYSEDQLRDVNNRFGSNSFETITPTGTNVLLQNQVLNPGFNNDQQSQWLSIYDNSVSDIPPQTCGNGITEGYELCDILIQDWSTFPLCTDLGYSPAPGNLGLHIGCNAQCSFDRQGLTNFECDGTAPGGGATTSTGNNCGNGQIDPFEQCDIDAAGNPVLGGATCESVGLGFTSGQLGCRRYLTVNTLLTCSYDFSNCRRDTPGCGDGVVSGVEQCDPPGSVAPCESIDLNTHAFPTGGSLYCSPTCDWDLGYCTPYGLQVSGTGEANPSGPTPIPGLCGNNVINPGEQCDGTILASATCQSLGYQTGTLVCTGCRFDIRGCGNQGGLVTVVAVGPEVEDVEVGDVVAIAANATCNAFGLNNFLTDRNQYCIVDESDIAVTLQEGNLFFDKTDVQTQAGFSAAVPVSGSDIDNF